jgi:predicted MFS family arabinose efflux permease
MVEDRRDLPNAIALNSSMVNGTRIIGPSIGGVLIAAFGEGWCFAVDAISYVAVIASILAMRVRPRAHQEAAEMHLLEELHHGWKYVFHSIPIRSALLLVAIVSTAGTPYTVLMPAIAAQVLHGGPNTLGLLMTGTGVGALTGALYLAQRESVLGLGRIIMWASVVFGIGLVIFSLTTSLWPAFLVLAIAGCGFMIHLAATNTILQTIVEERLRGRVMSFYTMAFFGTVPIGSLLGGIMAEHYGAPRTVLVSGITCLAGSAWFAYKLPAIRAVIRPIYRERGIITVPAVDTGAKTL